MRHFFLPLLALGLTGCSMVQSNVKGGFSCAAPHGTCAPSTVIDDGALHAIDTNKTDPVANASAAPSVEDARPRAAWAGPDTDPARGALKVVYPAWHDGSGHVHKRTVAYVKVDAPGLVSADGAAHASDNPAGSNLLTVAESAPDLVLVSPARAVAPSSEVPAEPRPAATNAATPLGTIKAQVRDILAKTPKPTIKANGQTSPSPAQAIPVAPTPTIPATTGGTFPPQGE